MTVLSTRDIEERLDRHRLGLAANLVPSVGHTPSNATTQSPERPSSAPLERSLLGQLRSASRGAQMLATGGGHVVPPTALQGPEGKSTSVTVSRQSLPRGSGK